MAIKKKKANKPVKQQPTSYMKKKYMSYKMIRIHDNKNHILRPVSYLSEFNRDAPTLIPMVLYCKECDLFFGITVKKVKIETGVID